MIQVAVCIAVSGIRFNFFVLSAAKAELRDLKIFLRPSVFFINYLPVAVKLSTSTDKYEGSSKVVESGRQIQVLDADVSRSTLKAEASFFIFCAINFWLIFFYFANS